MMDVQLRDLLDSALKVLVVVAVPTLLVPLVGLGVSLLQGMMGIREEGSQYAVRSIALAGVVLVFGASAAAAFVQLMQLALR